ncbi:MAG: bi-domain-containing oxidoreductase [Limisphaerales bacterium]
MKQILQDLKNGDTMLAEVPQPANGGGSLLIRSLSSVVSLGTEKMLIDFGKGGWLAKARQQPDKVKQVLGKIRTDGLVATYKAVQAKLDTALPLGYANCGFVLEAPAGSGYEIGDVVVSNGPHAEVVSVAKNLCAKVPEGVKPEAAAFTVIGSIALQGVRLIQPTLGETFVVTGLGLIGQLAVQILLASGCRVIGIDFDSAKCELARGRGAEVIDLSSGTDPVATAEQLTRGRGVDGVLVTASTSSSEPIHQAAHMCRKRGRIVLVGVTGLELSRADFYEKELSFQVSCSYGPGRYEPNYEDKGMDYPIGFVRWTEQRNFEAFLDLLAAGKIDIEPLISHRFDFAKALEGYERVSGGQALGIVLNYSDGEQALQKMRNGSEPPRFDANVSLATAPAKKSEVVIGVIGAGGFTGQVLLPGLKETGARLKTIVSSKGVSGTQLGRKFGFEVSSTDVDAVFDDGEINTVLITTRHDSHARYVRRGLEAEKNVYVEKPLCLTAEELDDIGELHGSLEDPFLMVGFNRRFAPHIVKMKSLLNSVKDPKSMIMTVNAGAIPADHWTQDPQIGGGRIVGEGCHFIDLLRFLAGYSIKSVSFSMAGIEGESNIGDTVSLTLTFTDGSIGTIHYFANGNKGVAKERLEVFCGGKVLQLDNFRSLMGHGWKGFNKMKLWAQDKGHRAEMKALVDAVGVGAGSPIAFDEIREVTKASFPC